MYLNFNEKLHPADFMILELAKGIKDKDTVFYGVSSLLPMIAAKFAKVKHAPNINILNIPGGVNSDYLISNDYSSASSDQWLGSEAVFPLSEIFDLSMRGKLNVAFLSGVQFDMNGNVNASVIGDYEKPKVRLPGGAGSAVLIPTVERALIWRTKHDTRTFVKEVDFITTKGNIDRIVTPLCTFEVRGGEFVVTSISPLSKEADIVKNTGFPITFDLSDNISLNNDDLRLINRLDPRGLRFLEFKKF